jgi:hypothetical protein
MTGAQALVPIRLVHRHRSMQVIVVNVDLEYIPISPAQVAGLFVGEDFISLKSGLLQGESLPSPPTC